MLNAHRRPPADIPTSVLDSGRDQTFGPQLMAQTQEGPAWKEQNSNPPWKVNKLPSLPNPPSTKTKNHSKTTPHPCRKNHTHAGRYVHTHTPKSICLTCWLNRRLGPIEKMWEYGSRGIFWGLAKKNRNATWLETLETCYTSLNWTNPAKWFGFQSMSAFRNELCILFRMPHFRSSLVKFILHKGDPLWALKK